MKTVYILVYLIDGVKWDAKVEGVCSTREIAEATRDALMRYDCSPIEIVEMNVDDVAITAMSKLKAEMDEYYGAKKNLEKLKGLL